MRLLTSAVFMICSWAVLVDVLACKNDNTMFIFKRTKGRGRSPSSRFKPYSPSKPGKSAGQTSTSNEPRDLPDWLKMEVIKTAFSTKAMVMMTEGKYVHPRTGVVYENPVVKAHELEDDKDKIMIYIEVSNLKRVEQYIDGRIVTYMGRDIALLFLVYQGRALVENNEADKKMYDQWAERSEARYLKDYGMRHMDPFITNYAYMRDQQLLNLLDWGFAIYNKVRVPSQRTLEEELDLRANLPQPPPGWQIPTSFVDHNLSPMETFIRMCTVHHLWGNHKANYYKLTHPNEAPTALKVSWVVGIREKQSFIMEVSNALGVKKHKFAGLLKAGESHEKKWISYLVVQFPGKMGEELQNTPVEDLQKLRQAAILRYKQEYGMIHLCPEKEYFTYDLEEKMAHIYDWSCARHEDLPDGTLQNFGELTGGLIKQKPGTCIPKLIEYIKSRMG